MSAAVVLGVVMTVVAEPVPEDAPSVEEPASEAEATAPAAVDVLGDDSPVIGAYREAIAAADTAVAEAFAKHIQERDQQRQRADARFLEQMNASAEYWRRAQKDANAKAMVEFRRLIAEEQRAGNLVEAQRLADLQGAFAKASVGQGEDFDASFAEITVSPAPAVGPEPDAVVVEARVYGESALHVTTHGLFWENVSRHRKPQGITLDGRPWSPEWRAAGLEGADTSAIVSLEVDLERAAVELLYASEEPGGKGRRVGGTATTRWTEAGLVVHIADHPLRAGWYGMRIRGVRPPKPAHPSGRQTRAPRPVDAVLYVLDDDANRAPTAYINGESLESKANQLSAYLTRYTIEFDRTDRLVVVGGDLKAGNIAYAMVSRDGDLLAYSKQGVPVSASADAAWAAVSWEPAVAIQKGLGVLQGQRGMPDTMPRDWTAIWKSDGGMTCAVAVWPLTGE